MFKYLPVKFVYLLWFNWDFSFDKKLCSPMCQALLRNQVISIKFMVEFEIIYCFSFIKLMDL